VADCGSEKLDLRLVKMHYGNWDERYRLGRFVRLSKEDEYLFIRAVNRFSEDYKRRLRKELWSLRCVKWDLKIELTLDTERYMRLSDEFALIDPAWAKVRAWLYKRHGIFSFSRFYDRSMLDVGRIIESKGYTFGGSVEESEVRTFCVEENVVYDDFVRAKVTNDILYQYPQLFDVSDTG
jgi:hypothetical protein